MSNSTLSRRQLLRLSTTAGVAAALPDVAQAFQGAKPAARAAAASKPPAGSCSTPRSAVAGTRYGKVRGYVEDGVFTFKGIPYGAKTGGENRWLPAKPPKPWDGEYPALIYGANCPQRLHDWVERADLPPGLERRLPERRHAQAERLDAEPDRQAPGDGLLPRRRLHLRLVLRTALARRRADGAPPRRRAGVRQSPPEHPRVPRPLRDRRRRRTPIRSTSA